MYIQTLGPQRAVERLHVRVIRGLPRPREVHIQPGRPTQNARVESFHGRLREECLSVSWFQNLFDARRKIAAWRTEYNEERPHSRFCIPSCYADALLSYDGLANDYAHKVIDHAESYVDGRVHTNSLENFWSLLKRGISGTYVSVEPFHLFRYLDEQTFRYNNRKEMTDADRFNLALSQIAGKRLTFAELTGKLREEPF